MSKKLNVECNIDDKGPKKSTLIIISIIFIIILLFNLKFSIAYVSGESMEPTLHDGQLLLAEKHTDIDRFDIVIIMTDECNLIIKRVIGLPGDTVEYKDNKLYINNELVDDPYGDGITEDFSTTVSDNCYYCLGDNRENSSDSRFYGEFDKSIVLYKIRRR